MTMTSPNAPGRTQHPPGRTESTAPNANALRRARRRLFQYPSMPLVAAMCVVACLGYSGVFVNWGFLTPLIVATLGASAAAFVSRRYKLLIGEAVLVTVLGFFVLGVIVTQWVPGPSAPADFARALTNGWADLLSSQTPTTLNGERAVVPFTTGWVATALAQELDRRVRFSGIAIVGVLVGLVATSLFSTEVRSLARVQGPILIAGTIILGLLHRTEKDRTGLSIANSTSGVRRRILAPAVVLLVIMGLAAIVGPRLPLAEANDRFDLRDRQENPWDPLNSPSPLVTLKADLKEDVADTVAFRATSIEPITRFTVAVMATYDGVVWQVADPSTDTAAQFVPVDAELPDAPDRGLAPTDTVTAVIEIDTLDGPWIPHAGDPTEVRFADQRELRLNLATRTLAHPAGLVTGDRYELTAQRHPAVTDVAFAEFAVDDRSIELQLVPAPVRNLAAQVVEGADFGGPQVAEIRDLLTLQGFYDSGPAIPPGHSYARIASFIDNPERIVGYEEQYAATAAVLARLASIPTRVAVGYTVDEADWVDGSVDVLAEHASAWIEVDVRGVGWVPVDVTPDRSREPTEQEIGRVTRNVAVPNEPPPPPPPQQSDDDDEIEEEDEEDEEEEDEDSNDNGGSLFAALLERPGLVAGTVAISPLVGFGLLALLAAGLKLMRARRRRNAETTRLQVAGAWAELVDRFEEAGHPVAPNATPAEIVEQLRTSGELAEAEPEIRQLAALVSQSAFAADDPSAAEVDRAWNHADQATDVAVGSLSVLERARMRIDPRPLLRRGPSSDEDDA